MDISTLTLCGAAEGLRKRAFSSVELTQAVLDAGKSKGAYLSVDAEGALRQAAEADAARAAGKDSDVLGVPLAVQDSISINGQPLSCGSKIQEGFVSLCDATVVTRLRQAGAVFAGRTGMEEFGRVSAAALTGGGVIAMLGCDTGGDVRQAAATGGCVGLKPSYGRVSRNGVVPYASSMDQAGPLGKTVEDAAVLLRAMAGADPLDGTALVSPVPDYRAALGGGLKGLRVGVPKEYFPDGADAEVTASVRKAIDGCAKAGAEIVEVSLPHTAYAVAAYAIISAAEAATNLGRFDGVRFGYRAANAVSVDDLFARSRGDGFGAEVKRRIILGTWVVGKECYGEYFVRAQKVRTLIRRDFEEAFKACDVLMAPVAPTLAQKAAGDPVEMYQESMFTAPASLAGICGLSVPCGKTGLQVLGPAFGEDLMLRAAYAYEKEVRT